jgi:predicted nucleic acid-binding Zn ribbon protein
MHVIYDVKCTSCGNIDEVYGRKGDTVRCTVCSSDSRSIISPVNFVLEGVSGDFPGAAMKWNKRHK